MPSNAEITRNALNTRQVRSLLNLQQKVETSSMMFHRVTPAQFKAMQTAYNALVDAGQEIPAEAKRQAKILGLIG